MIPGNSATPRYEKVSDDLLNDLKKTTKSQTTWAIKIFKDWLSFRKENTEFEDLPVEHLGDLLRRFYAEVRKKDGTEYSRSGIVNLRAAINRHLSSPPCNREFNIIHDRPFQAANQVFNGVVKQMKREGKDITVHKTPIGPGDMVKLRHSNKLSPHTPWGLVRKLWFDIMLHFGRRGQEGLRDLRKRHFILITDDENRSYYTMSINEKDKTHIGLNKRETQKDCRMYAVPDDPLCPVASLTKYLCKLDPGSEDLFSYPIKSEILSDSDAVWYTKKPIGHNRLDTFMKEISQLAGLSKSYTNHGLKATAATVLWQNGVPVQGIMSVTGHRNEASLRSYVSGPSNKQREEYSHILHSASSNARPKESATYSQRSALQITQHPGPS